MLDIMLKTAVNLIVGVTFVYLFTSTVIPVYGSSVLIDVATRHNINDAFISFYYLLWTLFYYLPEFFLLMFLVTLYFRFSSLTVSEFKWVAFLLLLNVIYLSELVDFISLNACLDQSVFCYISVNSLLLNFLNRYHPLCFYAGVLFTANIICVFLFISVSDRLYFRTNLRLYELKINNAYTFAISLASLWMGSWWALQEGTWGGWWNSDISEMLGLCILIITIVNTHKVFLSSRLHYHLFFIYVSFISFLTLYYFIQVNYELTSHNFGSRFFFFFNNNLLLLELIILLVGCMFKLTYRYVKALIVKKTLTGFKRFSRLNTTNLFFITQLWGFTSLSLWFLTSLLPLIDIFTQKYIHVVDITLFSLYKFTQLTLVVLTLLFFFNTSLTPINHIFSLFLFIPNPTLLIIPFSNASVSISRTIHLSLVSFLILNICTSDLMFLYWSSVSSYTTFYSTNTVYAFYTPVFICDSVAVNKIFISTDFTNNLLVSWTTMSNFSTYDTDQFLLLFNNDVLLNYYFFIADWVRIFILIQSTDTNIISFLSLATLTLILVYLKIFKASSLRLSILY